MKSGFGEPLDSFLCSTGTVLWNWHCSGNPAGFLTCLSPTPHTHAFKCNDTHRHIWNQTHAHTKHTKNDRHTGDTQLGSHTLAGGLQTHRSDHSHTHTHTPCSANLCHTALPVPSSQWQREKKLKNTLLTLVLGCHLTYTECISNSWEYLVSACSILRLHAHTQAAISGHWKPAFSSKVKLRWTFIAFKNLSCRESKAVGSGSDQCAWFLSAWEGQILVFMQESSLAEPNKNFVEFSSVTNRDNTNYTTQASCFILSLSQTPFLLTYKKKKHHE